jgi:hypothetical protein
MSRIPPRATPGRDAAARSSSATDSSPASAAPIPRGIRNNNPLNIRIAQKNEWRGEVLAIVRSDSEFEQFEDPVFGLRAAIRLIRTHYRRGSNTIRKLAIVWAPPGENPHLDNYVRAVARHAGINPDTTLDFSRDAHLRPVLLGMIRAENGMQPYSEMTIDTAFALAAHPPLRVAHGETV